MLMGMPSIQQPSAVVLKRLHDTAVECLNGIKNLGVDTSTWDPLLVHIMSQKLDSDTHNEYISSLKQPRELPVLKEFLQFLENKFTSLEASRRKEPQAQISTLTQYNNFQSNNKYQKPVYLKNSFISTNKPISQPFKKQPASNLKPNCFVCNDSGHGIFFCPQFIQMPPHMKLKTVNDLELCKNCLYKHSTPCFSQKFCRECNGNHNTILHDAFSNRANAAKAPPSSNQKHVRGNSHVSLQREFPEVLLATAMVRVQAADGTYHELRALLDQGSQTSLITEKAAQQLRLTRKKCQGIISGIGAKESSCHGVVSIKCLSMNTDYSFEAEAFVMKNLIKKLPSYSFAEPQWKFFDEIKLADPKFNISSPVDILFGADIYSKVLMEGIYRAGENLPMAQQTQLGWILSGNVSKTFHCNITMFDTQDIQQFWEIEDISDSTPLTSADQKVMDFYENTTRRLPDGRYEVRLPMKEHFEQQLGSSKGKAIAQFENLERKLSKQPNIASEYKAFMDEYRELGHMKPAQSNSRPEYHLPHHCVLREESSTTKLRVVFNGSARGTNGHSLNDLMESGPNLQQDMLSLLIKWRKHRFVITADIEKMFRQTWIHPEDQKLQKIIWRDTPSEPLQEYQLTTISYGQKSAPFLAMMTLRKLARDEKPNYQSSNACDVIETSFFMDDLVHGCNTIAEAKQLKQDLIEILKSGGFNLRKWKSNTPELAANSQEEAEKLDFRRSGSNKTLGLCWDPKKDQFSFQSKMLNEKSSPREVSKRTLLSDISKLFDPLGWLSPVTTKLKLLFQHVWLSKIEWGDPVPEDIKTEWLKSRDDLENINSYEIQRWLNTEKGASIELHGFCDSSMKAYACVIYCKTNQGSVVQVVAKARLVPIKSKEKQVSLPRLELCGALLLARLMEKVVECLSDFNITIHGWTDSMVVLGWLQGDTGRWKTFVASRVEKILKIMPSDTWNYVQSTENPADCASRGITAAQLYDHTLWWKGPQWLPSYDSKQEQITSFTTEEEIKRTKQINVVVHEYDVIDKVLEHYSSYTKAIRAIAWLTRYVTYLLNRKQTQSIKYLTINELKEAKNKCIKQAQKAEYSREISSLLSGDEIHSKSKILSLRPYLDSENILRVGGRLKNADISSEIKHPIIIPNNSRLAELLIDHAHSATFHAGPKLTSAFIRQKYWIVGGLRATKKQIRKCVACRKQSPSKHHQLMGDLPEQRVNQSKPFYHTGIDYTGHVFIKSSKGRGIKTSKGYVAVFVCMVTKAVHLELVSDLSTSAFIAALRRTTAKVGKIGHLYSDNGTNFLGASRVLAKEYEEIKNTFDNHFMSTVAEMEIQWHFQAPSWPSAGGIWEAAVKSLKHHLKRVIGEQKLTYEEFATLLAQLEACLNSRPLCPLTEDPDDVDFLTPAHFLTGGPALLIPDTEHDLRSRWQHMQKIYQDIWNRWQSEYLTQLSQRSKWCRKQANFQIGDIVIIHDANLPAGKWPLGRIIQLHPGQDGLVRVVSIKTKNGILKRPIVKLSILPVHEQKTSSAEEQKQESPKPSRNQSSKPKRSINLVAVLTSIMFFLSIMSPGQCAYSYQSLLPNKTLYFEKITNIQLIRDEWRLIVYYNMEPYYHGMSAVAKYLSYLNSTCEQIKTLSECEEVVLQLRHSQGELQHYNSVLLSQHLPARAARRRRGIINGVGMIANELFGVLDSRFAENYERDIKLIRKNLNHLAELWKNQTTIVEAEFNLIIRTEQTMERQHKTVNQKINKLQNSINYLQSQARSDSIVNEFTMSALIANNLITQLKSLQNTLLNTITNIYSGKLDLHLLTPEQLRRELNDISARLPKDLTLPPYETSSIYHLLKVKAKMTESYLLFEISIPLITRDNYELMKIFPIPKQVAKYMVNILPVSSYVAVNLQQDAMILLSEAEIEKCLAKDQQSMLCHHSSPIFKIMSDENLCQKDNEKGTCKVTYNPCVSSWTPMKNINSYLYFCCDECKLKMMCENQVTALQLRTAGLFTMGKNCIMKSADFTLFSHRMPSNNLSVSADILSPVIAPINHIINITLPVELEPEQTENNEKQFTELKQKIDEMKKSVPLTSEISYHDIHHYSIIYVMISMAVAVAGVFAWRRARAPRAPRASPRAQVQLQLEPLAPAAAAPAQHQCVKNDQCECSVQKCSDIKLTVLGNSDLKADYHEALAKYEKSLIPEDPDDPQVKAHNDNCEAGIARMSIRCGDAMRGITLAMKHSTNKTLLKDCAELLEEEKQYSHAATLYDHAGNTEKAASLYIKLKSWLKVEALLPKINSPSIHLQYAKAKEAEGRYADAMKSYLKAQDYEAAIRLNLEKLDDIDEAVTLVQETKSVQGAKMVANYFQNSDDPTSAIKFLVMSLCYDDAFQLARKIGKLQLFGEILIQTSQARPEDFRSLALHFEGEKNHLLAGKFFFHAGEYSKAMGHLLKAGTAEEDDNEAISVAIDAAAASDDERLTRRLIEYLLGETDGAPREPRHLFRLYMAKKQYAEAAKTAVIIARSECAAGRYREARDVLRAASVSMRPAPRDVAACLAALHCYILVSAAP
ncbi:unnamed protein product [Plutella xylostella]|uniref:(diamondback moth) hypothetical protein n=1 Tax=Plutella xylostella TaxID=51655 RepID=A0A8S4D7L8_PLUXY|nr:unnamed protein product [Plutella xylostella]